GGARLEDEAVPQRAAGVLSEEERVRVVVQPAEPEEEALLRRAGRVVGERVQSQVEVAEGVLETGRGIGQRLRSLLHVLERRLHSPRERPDLMVDRAQRVVEEGSRLAERRAERLG